MTYGIFIDPLTGLGPNTHFGIKYIYNSAESNTNTPVYCFSRFQFKYKFSIQIQIHCHFLFKYNSNTLPFLKFDSNTIQIRGPCFHYSSRVPQNFV